MKQIKQVSTAARNKSDSLEKTGEAYPSSFFSLLFLVLQSWMSLNKAIHRTLNFFYSAVQIQARFAKDTVHTSVKENVSIQYP